MGLSGEKALQQGVQKCKGCRECLVTGGGAWRQGWPQQVSKERATGGGTAEGLCFGLHGEGAAAAL